MRKKKSIKFCDLIKIKHNEEFVHNIINKCNRMIDNIITKEQQETVYNYIENARIFIKHQEHYNCYKSLRMWFFTKINKDKKHRMFFEKLDAEFDELIKKCNKQLKTTKHKK